MAASCFIGSENLRRQISVGRDAGWREIIEVLSGALEFCHGKLLGAFRFRLFVKSKTCELHIPPYDSIFNLVAIHLALY